MNPSRAVSTLGRRLHRHMMESYESEQHMDAISGHDCMYLCTPETVLAGLSSIGCNELCEVDGVLGALRL